MNRTYNIEDFSGRYFDATESNCAPVRIVREKNDSAVDVLANLIGKLCDNTVIFIIRAILAVACLIGFFGIIGGMDAGTISIGAGVVVSIILFAIEFLIFSFSSSEKK